MVTEVTFKFPECQKWKVSGSSLFLFLFSHSGKDDNCNVCEYLSCITQAILEKVAAVLGRAYFFAVLSADGSQARKTGSDKELVMVRVERNGKIVFLI